MKREFRPTEEQMWTFTTDLELKLQELGIIAPDHFIGINGMVWYDWDNDPRWFINVDMFEGPGKAIGYVEVDCWPYLDTIISPSKVEVASHGYPCQSTEVVHWNQHTDTWVIAE